ncbi:MAG: hypothetical protein WC655_03525 [Candidatus Hydrogenedentales bacterium]
MEKPQFRLAVPGDIPFILELLREFYRRAGAVYAGIPFDGPSTILTVAGVLAGGLCLVGPSSCAGANFVAFPYNHTALVAHVQFWYFKNAREIAIFEALCDACKVAGATHIWASSHAPGHTIAKWYRRKGLSECESEHIRGL